MLIAVDALIIYAGIILLVLYVCAVKVDIVYISSLIQYDIGVRYVFKLVDGVFVLGIARRGCL